ncbi:MAG: hypothetical protein WC548_00705 [Candidatus Pacearchaeota archaeon]
MALEKELEEDVEAALTESIRRMAEFPNPVELVNNMYGCHPDPNGNGYFSRVYASSN